MIQFLASIFIKKQAGLQFSGSETGIRDSLRCCGDRAKYPAFSGKMDGRIF